jgi:hypothetical protein
LLLPPPPQHGDHPPPPPTLPPPAEAKLTAAGSSVVGPVLICLFLLVSYVGCSSVLLAQLRGWPYLESLYYCCMTLLTVGAAAADNVPDRGTEEQAGLLGSLLYILIGLILEATCLHILYEEVYLKVASRRRRGRERPEPRGSAEVT